jgi:hypothetical protein
MEQGFHQGSGFRRLLARFPGREDAIRRAALGDRTFRELCDDLLLAITALERFERRPDAAQRIEIPEYRRIIAELEAELTDYLATRRRG